jgi:glutathione S-transferase
MAIKFYYSPLSSSTRVHWALEELGLAYEKVKIDLTKGEQKSPDFLAINPNGKVPALVDGDVRMFESLAMIIHLGEKYGVEKGLWPKAGTVERADALTWSVWGTAEMLTPIVDYVLHAGDMHFSFPADKRSKVVADSALERWNACVKILDARLEGRDYMLGKMFTLVDVATASLIGMATMMGKLPLNAKNIGAWAARCQGRPAMGKAMAG